jgi:hypothetical protein
MTISKVIYKSDLLSRVTEIYIEGKKLITPTYFPAISSYGIKYRFGALMDLLITYSYPRVLTSLYDLHLLDEGELKRQTDRIRGYSRNGGFVFLDSGIYESFWRSDSRWDYNLYKTLVPKVHFDFYGSFDVLPDDENNTQKFINRSLSSIVASRELSDKQGFVPILHERTPTKLVSLVQKFVKEHPHLCHLVAIPERDCGDSFLEKARTIGKIRKVLDSDNDRRILHVLGCGNPLSLIIFSYCGADVFDSLDWIKYVIDQSRLIIHDFSYLELIECRCEICIDKERNYIERVLLHNLLFYQNFLQSIQLIIRNNEFSDFLTQHIGRKYADKIRNFVL